jgi:hypothetical protein
LIFGFVSAQSQAAAGMLLRQNLAKKPKILAPHGYSISSNALEQFQTTLARLGKTFLPPRRQPNCVWNQCAFGAGSLTLRPNAPDGAGEI